MGPAASPTLARRAASGLESQRIIFLDHVTPTWKARRARARALAAEHDHAADLLEFYASVLDLQEPLYDKVGRATLPAGLVATKGEDGPRLRLERFQGALRDREFTVFVNRVARFATDVLAAVAKRVEAADIGTRADLLQAFLARRSLDEAATSLACHTAPLEFFPKAFMQPVAEALLAASGPGPLALCALDGAEASCPACGWPPLLSLLRDEPEVRGQRSLVCSLCSSEWPFPRTRCPGCGETRSDRLQCHATDFWPHVRIEECGTCHTYLKTIDLRKDGRAVPVVDELASVELDLWAVGEGLTKGQRNLLGL